VGQPMVDRHLVDLNMSQSSTQARYINENASTSENPNTLVLGNHEESNGIEEISINYTSSGEVYNCSTTIVNSSFSTIIAESVPADLDPKTMVECKRLSD
jgi:protein associated with RNAse G/E